MRSWRGRFQKEQLWRMMLDKGMPLHYTVDAKGHFIFLILTVKWPPSKLYQV